MLPQEESRNKHVYPKECNLCKKYHIKVNQKDEYPITITTTNAEEFIKAAVLQTDEEMHYQIKDLDLISKEYHAKCYRNVKKKVSHEIRQPKPIPENAWDDVCLYRLEDNL